MSERRAWVVARLERPRRSGMVLVIAGIVAFLSIASAVTALLNTEFLF
jgi:hypothetical protein